MKKLLIAGLTLLSANAFSQSYTVLGNGVTLTIDSAGFVYDFSQFILPYKVTGAGGQFLIDEEKLVTITSKGFTFRTEMKVKKIKGKGSNYFVNGNSELVTINPEGLTTVFDFDKLLKKETRFGGTYMVTPTDIITVGINGLYTKLSLSELKLSQPKHLGGNYFVTADGVVHTVSAEGFVFTKTDITTGTPKKLGGNFFIDSADKIFTVSEEGYLLKPTIPKELILTDVTKVGANYLLDSEGQHFTVDKKGNVNLRKVDKHDLRGVRVLSI